MLQLDLDEWLGRRVGWPEGRDFLSGACYRNPAVDIVLAKLAALPGVLIVGGEGRGKTTIATQVGLEWQRAGTPVWVIDCSEGSSATPLHLAAAIETRNTRCPLWIIDDCQNDAPGVEKLATAIHHSVRSRFLFVQRDLQLVADADAQLPSVGAFTLIQREAIVPVQPDLPVVERIIDAYVTAHGLQDRFVPRPTTSADDIESILSATGANLRRLRFFLDAWNPKDRALSKLGASDIARYIVEHTLAPLAFSGVQETYVRVCALTHFDRPISAGPFDVSALQSLVGLGLLSVNETQEHRSYRTAHASDSRQVIEAWAWWRGVPTHNIIRDSMRAYLMSPASKGKAGLLQAAYAMGTTQLIDTATAVGVLAEFDSTSDINSITAILGLCDEPAPVALAIGVPRLIELRKAARIQPARAQSKVLEARLPAVADEVDKGLSIEDRIIQYTRASPRSVATSLYHYYNDRKSRHFARRVLAAYVGAPLQKHVELGTAAGWGRFLEVAAKIDSQHASQAARAVATLLPIGEGDSAEELSLLVKNCQFDQVAASRLVARIIDKFDPMWLVDRATRVGFSHLLKVLRDHWPIDHAQQAKAKQFFEFWNARADRQWLATMTDRHLAFTIWNFVVVGVDPSPWIGRSLDVIAARVSAAAWSDRFYLMWNLFQVGPEVAAQVNGGIARQLFSSVGTMSDAGMLATAGLLLSSGQSIDLSRASATAGAVDELFRQEEPAVCLLGVLALNALPGKPFAQQTSRVIRERMAVLAERIALNVKSDSRHMLEGLLDAAIADQ